MFCPKCGKEIEGKFCTNCGYSSEQGSRSQEIPSQPISQPAPGVFQPAPPTAIPVKKKKKGCLISLLVVAGVFVLLIVIAALAGNDTDSPANGTSASESSLQTTNTTTTTKKEEVTESKDSYIKSCKTIPYKTLAREPDKYKGQKVKFTGEVVQVVSDTYGLVTMRVNVTKNDYGYEDTVMVTCYRESDEPRILEKDIITFYGTADGLVTYETVLGASVSIPKISVKYVIMKE